MFNNNITDTAVANLSWFTQICSFYFLWILINLYVSFERERLDQYIPLYRKDFSKLIKFLIDLTTVLFFNKNKQKFFCIKFFCILLLKLMNN